MIDIAGFNRHQPISRLIFSLYLLAGLAQASRAQTYTPLFKSVEMQATIAPLGEMVEGDFFGSRSIAAISKSEKAIYFFEPDSLENLILTNVVSLPDTPIAISKGKEVIIDSTGGMQRLAKLAVLMKPDLVALISFDQDGQPQVSRRSTVDSYCTGIRTVDLETSGRLDLIGYGKFSLGVSIEENEGNGLFRAVQPMPGPLGNVPFSDIAFTDFNGDLVPDMAALDWVNRRLLIFYGRGDGTFAQPVSFPLAAEPSALSVADLNGNGYPDIVVGYKRLPEIDIFGGDGFGRFFLRQTIKTAAPVSKFAIADFTGDGTMDIAALSRSAREIMCFAYDPLSRKFQYSGVIGSGEAYDDIVPFYFRNRIKADLVASSPTQKYLKVFKSSVPFNKFSERLIPVGSGTESLSVCGSDTANYIITADTSGRITARFSNGTNPAAARSSVDWQSGGTPVSLRLFSGNDPGFLVSYSDADAISLYEVNPGANGVRGVNAETPFPPLAMSGETEDDSASIAAAYRSRADSTVGVSYFTAIRGRDEFLEHDYSVADTEKYVSSTVAISPALSFIRIWRINPDSLKLACTSLKFNATSSMILHASDARLLSLHGGGFPLLAVQGNDTLNLFSINSGLVSGFSLVPICSTPFDSANFSSIEVTALDSIYYLTFVNHPDKSVFLYTLSGSRLRFVRAWRVNAHSIDVALSPNMRTIYFLNRSEAYVSVHDF